MRVTADTNVLIRAVVRDEPEQAAMAIALLRGASAIVVTMACLCEFVWVLEKVYGFDRDAIASAIRVLTAAENVQVESESCEPALGVFEAGGDFADGVIAAEGHSLGAETFVSFDERAVKALSATGIPARLLT